jgi:hypothetical protein
MFYTGTPEFRFGHGLSYSSWQLNWAEGAPLALELRESETLRVSVNLRNLGGYDALKASKQTLGFLAPNIHRKAIATTKACRLSGIGVFENW